MKFEKNSVEDCTENDKVGGICKTCLQTNKKKISLEKWVNDLSWQFIEEEYKMLTNTWQDAQIH